VISMNPAENTKPAEEVERKTATQRKPPTAFNRLKRGLVEGLAVVCFGLGANATGCGYEVPSLDPVEIPDGGTAGHNGDGGQQNDGGTGGDAGVAGHDGGSAGMDAGTGGMDAGVGGHDGGTGGMDAGTGGMDAGSGGDAGMGGMDAGSGGMDAGTGGMDAGSGGMDAGSGGADAGIVCGSITTGSFLGTISSTTPRVVANYTFTYLGNDGGDAHFALSCGGDTFVPDISCPVAVETDVTRPDDGAAGKLIKITPNSANATTSSVQFVVQDL
jgi:hypothetical protein